MDKVLERALSREVAYHALARRRRGLLRAVGISLLSWGAFARVVRAGLVALARELRATGVTAPSSFHLRSGHWWRTNGAAAPKQERSHSSRISQSMLAYTVMIRTIRAMTCG